MVRRSRTSVLTACLVAVSVLAVGGCKEQAASANAPVAPDDTAGLIPDKVAPELGVPPQRPQALPATGNTTIASVAGVAGAVTGWLWSTGTNVATTVGQAVGQGAQVSVTHLASAGQMAGNAAWSGGAALVGAAEQGAQTSLNALETAKGVVQQLSWEISFALGINPPDTSPFANGALLSAQNDAGLDAGLDARIDSGVPAPAPTTPARPAPEPAATPLPATPPPTPTPVADVSGTVADSKDAPAKAEDIAALANQSAVLTPLLVDMPRREPDGSFFIPKAIQRLLDIRTQKVNAGDHPVRIKLPARVIPDPNAEGHVEASVMGRLETTERGLPILGQKVAKGEILAYVSPAIGVVDRTQIRRDVARLTTEIRAAAENLEILQKFSFVPFREGKIVQARMHLDGLRRERAALLPLLDTREALRAPTDGVVSSIEVVTGQVLQPGQIAFQIVNPGHLWIEASAADPGVAAEAAGAQSADAVTPEGAMLSIRFAGTGLSMQQQSALLNYAIDNPPEGLRVGRPVTVFATRRNQHHQGIAVPHEGVVNGPSGMDEVWERLDPEHFMPRPVHAEDLDGHTVLVINGLNDGAQVVVHSARLLAQYQ